MVRGTCRAGCAREPRGRWRCCCLRLDGRRWRIPREIYRGRLWIYRRVRTDWAKGGRCSDLAGNLALPCQRAQQQRDLGEVFGGKATLSQTERNDRSFSFRPRCVVHESASERRKNTGCRIEIEIRRTAKVMERVRICQAA